MGILWFAAVIRNDEYGPNRQGLKTSESLSPFAEQLAWLEMIGMCQRGGFKSDEVRNESH